MLDLDWTFAVRLKGRDQLSNEFSFLYLQGSFATLAWNKSILPRAKHRVTRNGLKRGLTPLILCRCVTRGKRSNWQVKHGYPLIPSYYAFAWFPGNVFDSVRGFLLRGVVRPPLNIIFASHCILVYNLAIHVSRIICGEIFHASKQIKRVRWMNSIIPLMQMFYLVLEGKTREYQSIWLANRIFRNSNRILTN